jgi:hypothetical protein
VQTNSVEAAARKVLMAKDKWTRRRSKSSGLSPERDNVLLFAHFF